MVDLMILHQLESRCVWTQNVHSQTHTHTHSMASTAPISVSTALVDAKVVASRQPSPQSVALPTFAPPQTQRRRSASTSASYCKNIARNVVAMATGSGTQADVSTDDVPEFVQTVQEAWDKLEDKYAVSSLAVAGIVALWGSTGLLSAIDRLPLIPGVLELVGIGYSGWFAYKNLVFKPDREALVRKIKGTYEDIIGTSS